MYRTEPVAGQDDSRTKVIQALRLASREVRRIYFILLASQDKNLGTGKTFGCEIPAGAPRPTIMTAFKGTCVPP